LPGTYSKILVYYPDNKRSVAVETLIRTIVDAGYEVIVLTLTARGPFHEELEKKGIRTLSHVLVRKNAWTYFYKHSRFLARFCKKEGINIVLSHLQDANFIAVLSSLFLKAKVTTFRHHDESSFFAEYGERVRLKRNKKEVLIDWFINRFSKKIVVLSEHVKESMIRHERCSEKKIVVCPLIYDFSMYPLPEPAVVYEVRQAHPCNLLLLMVSRFISTKQHLPVFEVVSGLIKEGLSIKIIALDEGPLKLEMEKFVMNRSLGSYIYARV